MDFTWKTLKDLFENSALLKADLVALGLDEIQIITDLKEIERIVGDQPLNSHIFVAPDKEGTRHPRDIAADFENTIRGRISQIHLLADFFKSLEHVLGGKDLLSVYPSNPGMREQLYATMYLKHCSDIGGQNFAVEQIMIDTDGRKDADVVIGSESPIHFHTFKVGEEEKSWRRWQLYSAIQQALRGGRDGVKLTNTDGNLPNPRSVKEEVFITELIVRDPNERIVIGAPRLLLTENGSYAPDLAAIITNVDEIQAGIPCTLTLQLGQKKDGQILGGSYPYQLQFERPTEELLPDGTSMFVSQGKGTGSNEFFRLPNALEHRSDKLPDYECLNVFVCMLRGVGTVQEGVVQSADEIAKSVAEHCRANAVIFLNAEFTPNNTGLSLTRAERIFGPLGQEAFVRKLTEWFPETHFIPLAYNKVDRSKE